MSADPTADAVRMAECGLIVAAAVLPVSAVASILSRRRGGPVWPRWEPWCVPWTGIEVLFSFALVLLVIPGLTAEILATSGFYEHVYGPDFPGRPAPPFETQAAAAGGAAAAAVRDHLFVLATVRELCVGLFALPLQVAVLVLGRRLLFPTWHTPTGGRAAPARIALIGLAWAVLTPVVLLVHLALLGAFKALGLTPEEHPLARLGGRPDLDRVLFILRACVTTPLIEELLFRGILLPWLRKRPRRVWVVLAMVVVVAAASGSSHAEIGVFVRGPVLFAGGLGLGWAVLSGVLRRKRRTVGAVYASAALFAAVHSGVWPSPVPLFVFGLGLGYLAVRTRGFLVPAAVHGLFNAVSVLFVLRSPG